MSFVLFTDSSSNLTPDLAREWDAIIIPFHYMMDGIEHAAYGEDFDGHAFFDLQRAGHMVKTSMVNFAQFTAAFEKVLEQGKDLLYIGMSGGISGTANAAATAAEELREKYPDRKIFTIDTLAASFGEGLFVEIASKMRAEGKAIEEIVAFIQSRIPNMQQLFTVDDLKFLSYGGRISHWAATFGTLAKIKPILRGNTEGKIVLDGKIIGRKRSIRTIAEKFCELVQNAEKQRVAIAHCDCEDDANELISEIRKTYPKQDFLVRCYEPGTGAHVGPGALALFFFGAERKD